jgi:hypothetical protein
MLGVARVCGMRTGVTVYLSSTDRKRLHAMVADRNQQPKPFAWTADPDKIIAAANRGHQVLDEDIAASESM